MIQFILDDKPHGYRDVYWCISQREPMIIQYENELARCPNCGYVGDIKTDFVLNHEFMLHLLVNP